LAPTAVAFATGLHVGLDHHDRPETRAAAHDLAVRLARTGFGDRPESRSEGSVERALIVVATVAGVAVVFFVLERLLPLRHPKRALLGRLLVNLAFSALALVAASLLVRPVVEASLGRVGAQPLGLVHLAPLPLPLRSALAFLLMDLSFYYWHMLNHRVPMLWRFHNVHHVDPDLDVSTALRFHFGELAFSAGFRIVQILLIGVSPWVYAAYEVVFQANTLFHHSNVRLPIRLERALNKLLVTPRMHGIHHSQVPDETNSNHGVASAHRLILPPAPARSPPPASPSSHTRWAARSA
jgi:sterol desaturase/sphingolipid hydroxylase (fatty acid hydroxylase superfamily)